MGIDKSLTDDFPSIRINGDTYHYGKETDYGQYLVENATYAKDYWVFDTAEELRAFLICLPQSAIPVQKVFPDWESLSEEERSERLASRRADLQKLAAERSKDHWFNILQFEERNFYSVYHHWKDEKGCDSLDVVVQRSEGKESRILLKTRIGDREEQIRLTFSRRLALKLADSVLRAISDIDQRP